jgi:hypothetical protein
VWRVAEDDPDSDLYAASAHADTVIRYMTAHVPYPGRDFHPQAWTSFQDATCGNGSGTAHHLAGLADPRLAGGG